MIARIVSPVAWTHPERRCVRRSEERPRDLAARLATAPSARRPGGRVPLLALAVVAAAAPWNAALARQAPPTPPPIVRPGLPGQPSQVVDVATVREATRPHSDADIRFMQGMIGHHAQALALAALVPDRTGREDVRLLARRIQLSQVDEIDLMRRWLEQRGAPAPNIDAEHTMHMEGTEAEFMPGMLTHEEIARLEAARGPDFDRLFLEFMIRHHEGALAMVDELRAAPGGGVEDEINTLTIHIVADQSSEILRMQRMLAETGR